MARHGEVFEHIEPAHIVNLADTSALENGENSSAMIRDMEPIALLLAVAVNRQGLAVERIGNHEGQKFFWKLERTIVVGGTRDDGWEIESANVGPDDQVRASFRGRVGAARLQR